MEVFISQLIDEKDYLKIIDKYQVNLEIIDFSIADVLDNPQPFIENYLDAKYDEITLAIHGPYFDLIPATFDSLIREATLKRFNQTYEIAKKINAKYIIFHTGYLKNIYFYESWLANSILFWNEFLKDKDNSIQIYLENVFEDDYHAIKKLMTTINNPIFNLCVDLGHANIRNNYQLKDWIFELKDYIKHFHFHNNDGNNDQHQSIIKGTIDYQEILHLIKQLNINASCTLELSSKKAIIDSLSFIKESMKK